MTAPSADRSDAGAYQRVLIVSLTKVKADDPPNLLIRTQFGDWPADRLAQIHSGETAGTGEFCGRYYRLQAGDRLFGRVFRRLRDPVFEMTMPLQSVGGGAGAGCPRATLRRWATAAGKRLGDAFVRSGLWELAFPVRISARMARFVEDFRPDVVYCQGYTLTFATLPLLIARRYRLPVVFQTTDDWPRYGYRGSPAAWLLRRRAGQLVRTARLRLAFGEKMRQAYQQRYAVDFLATYHADDPARFPVRARDAAADEWSGPRQIVFSGSLSLRRHEAVADLIEAVRLLGNDIPPVRVLVYCPGLPQDVPDLLKAAPELRFLRLPAHTELPAVLANADLLFLPESFTVDPSTIDLSLSTKCHLYMLSRTPILVYGPAYSGSVDYARRERWAEVVIERRPVLLAESLRRLLTQPSVGAHLTETAASVVRKYHDQRTVRRMFHTQFAALGAGTAPATGW